MATGRAVFGGRTTTLGAFLELLMFPTMLTMLVSGIWHGAGYLFILWGLLHGFYLTINHVWRRFGARLWRDRTAYERTMKPVGFVITFVAVVAGMVIFQSTTLPAAVDLLKGMAGVNGVALPAGVYQHLGPLQGTLQRLGVAGHLESYVSAGPLAAWLAILAFIVFAAPNTMQLLGRFEPALGVRPEAVEPRFLGQAIRWNPTLAWALGASAAIGAGVAIMAGGGQSPFLYFQF